jgi:ceramide glucosyltransferase
LKRGAKIWKITEYILLGLAAVPFIYYLLALYSTASYYSTVKRRNWRAGDFLPPVSCLKPIKGLDEGDYENFASFCRQDYPHFEILFCVDEDDAAVPIIKRLVEEFPSRQIRILYGAGRVARNDKVARLVRLVKEARYDLFVITDGDVRVRPDYLRSVVAPFADAEVGGGTCLYLSTNEKTLVEQIQTIGMISDFFEGIMVAWKLDGVKFAFGQTILARRKAIEGFGGYETIEDMPADDLRVGRMIAEQGYTVELLPYVVESAPDFNSLADLLHKRLRWMTVMHRMRPWGHVGLLFTWGLPWALIALAVRPTAAVAAGYLGGYLVVRVLMTWQLGIRGMRAQGLWGKMPLIPVWDLLAFCIWLASFTRSTIRWRGVDYSIRKGTLEPLSPPSSGTRSAKELPDNS